MTGPVVVGYDDSDSARSALDGAIDEAKKSRARLVVVSVVEMPLNPEAPQNFGTLDDSPQPMLPRGLPPELEPPLAHAAERLSSERVRANFVWAVGDPAAEIARTARGVNAALVALGSHHHSLLGRLFATDVAAEVERELGAGVVVVD